MDISMPIFIAHRYLRIVVIHTKVYEKSISWMQISWYSSSFQIKKNVMWILHKAFKLNYRWKWLVNLYKINIMTSTQKHEKIFSDSLSHFTYFQTSEFSLVFKPQNHSLYFLKHSEALIWVGLTCMHPKSVNLQPLLFVSYLHILEIFDKLWICLLRTNFP